jgi:multidrug transporter EmrE-like cation transporter
MAISLILGLLMALIDVISLSLLKAINLGWLKNVLWMIVPTAIYSLQPWLFLKSLQFESLTSMNLIWDMLSDVLVTLVGLFYFKESLSFKKMCGVGLSFVSIYLLCC